jgi:CRISPR-associated protein Csd1
MARLYETYEAAAGLDLPDEQKLMPVSHTLQNAHINIVIDGAGNFKRASVLEKTKIMLPATEKSAGRTSGEAPYPLADKIQYVARDYPDFGGRKKSYFASYQAQQGEWCASEVSHPKAVAVHNYICRGHVVDDLVTHGILHINEGGSLRTAWPEEQGDTPQIFKVLPKNKGEVEQGDALICWSVEDEGDPCSATWLDTSLQQSWISFDALKGGESDFCFVLGEERAVSVNHPAKLRHTGDKAKLISANDSSGFTFRGRFTDPSGLQAASVSFEVTQKAHNALRWLISRQGFRNNDQVFVAWAVSGKNAPDPFKASYDMFMAEPVWQEMAVSEPEEEQGIDHTVDLGGSFALKLRKYLAGYRAKLDVNEQIIIMGLDSATPGRMGIVYYRELLASEFLTRLEEWHSQFAWPQRHTIEIPDPAGKKKPVRKTVWPVSSPAPRAIVEAAYGDIIKSNDSLKKSAIERILPCIADGRPFPRDILLSAVRRAANRNNCEPWEWQKNLGVACALFKGFYLRHPYKDKRRTYSMALEEDRTTRDYLYGRLLAIAERIEETALRVGGEERPTTAARLMQRFADRPFSTWRNIELSLQPYMQRLQGRRAGFLVNRKKELDAILAAFAPGDFVSEKSLSGEFLLGYHCQKQAWIKNGHDEHAES